MSGLLRILSTVATVFVAAGFLLFAVDETHEGSSVTVSRIADASGSDAERAREERNGGVREAIDDVNDALTAPFDGVVSGSDSEWVRRGGAAVLGLLLYGFGLRLLANVAPRTRRSEPLGWETPR